MVKIGLVSKEYIKINQYHVKYLIFLILIMSFHSICLMSVSMVKILPNYLILSDIISSTKPKYSHVKVWMMMNLNVNSLVKVYSILLQNN